MISMDELVRNVKNLRLQQGAAKTTVTQRGYLNVEWFNL